MNYTKPSFTVPASSAKSPENCRHGWIDDKRKRCVLCGVPVIKIKFTESKLVHRSRRPWTP